MDSVFNFAARIIVADGFACNKATPASGCAPVILDLALNGLQLAASLIKRVKDWTDRSCRNERFGQITAPLPRDPLSSPNSHA